MPEDYYMCFVKGVPKSTQIKWFVENYSKGIWKRADIRHVEINKHKIDGDKDYAGVFIRDGEEYHYIFKQDTLNAFKSYTEVFYCVDDINIGEL